MRRISLTLLPAFVGFAIPGYAFAQTPARPPAQSPASPAPAAGPDGVMLVFERFADVYGSRLVAAFDSIPAGRYDYRPTPAARPDPAVGAAAQAADGDRALARGAHEVRRSVPARAGVRAAADAQGRLALRPGEHRERAGAPLARVAQRLLRQGGRCAGHVQVGRARRGHRARAASVRSGPGRRQSTLALDPLGRRRLTSR